MRRAPCAWKPRQALRRQATLRCRRGRGRRKMTPKDVQADAERLRSLIGASPDPIFFKDGEGHWLEINRPALELFALREDEYKGETDLELAALSPQHRAAHLLCASTDEETWKRKRVSRFEEVFTAADGSQTVLDVYKVPLFHPDGSRKGLVVFGRDITATKRAEESRRATEKQVRT